MRTGEALENLRLQDWNLRDRMSNRCMNVLLLIPDEYELEARPETIDRMTPSQEAIKRSPGCP